MIKINKPYIIFIFSHLNKDLEKTMINQIIIVSMDMSEYLETVQQQQQQQQTFKIVPTIVKSNLKKEEEEIK